MAREAWTQWSAEEARAIRGVFEAVTERLGEFAGPVALY